MAFLATQFLGLSFNLDDPVGFKDACAAGAAATSAGNLVIGRRLVEGQALPAVRAVGGSSQEEGVGLPFEQERLQAVIGFVVKGGLLPDLFKELMGMMCTVWWDRWAEEAAQTDAEAAAQAEAQQQG